MNTSQHRLQKGRTLSKHHFHPAMKLWGRPVALGLLSASGLVSALVSDGWGDTWAWFALGIPVLVMTWHALRR